MYLDLSMSQRRLREHRAPAAQNRPSDSLEKERYQGERSERLSLTVTAARLKIVEDIKSSRSRAPLSALERALHVLNGKKHPAEIVVSSFLVYHSLVKDKVKCIVLKYFETHACMSAASAYTLLNTETKGLAFTKEETDQMKTEVHSGAFLV